MVMSKSLFRCMQWEWFHYLKIKRDSSKQSDIQLCEFSLHAMSFHSLQMKIIQFPAITYSLTLNIELNLNLKVSLLFSKWNWPEYHIEAVFFKKLLWIIVSGFFFLVPFLSPMKLCMIVYFKEYFRSFILELFTLLYGLLGLSPAPFLLFL